MKERSTQKPRSVLLFRPMYDAHTKSIPVFPWALLYLASELARRDVRIRIIDEPCTPGAVDYARHTLETDRPVAVGISSMTGDQIRFGLRFARLVRQYSPKTAIVWGGIHPSLLPEQTAAHELVDYAIAGEGEYAFADLVDALAANGSRTVTGIPGVYGKCAGSVVGQRQTEALDFMRLPELPWDLFDVERYICRRPDLGVSRYFEVCTSRGCPHHCGFCYIESVHGSRWRAVDADTAVARVKNAVERFRLDCVSFREDNFFVSQKRAAAIARGIIDAKLDIKWAASCRINYFAGYDREFIELLRRSGCALLTFGVESGSNRILQFIRKGITAEMVIDAAEKVRAAGIRGTYHFMGGFPSETAEEFLETCRLIESLRRLGSTVVAREMSIFAPYPGVALIPECVKRGYIEPESLEQWIQMDWTNSERPWLTAEQSRLISEAQFLIARLNHPNRLVRAWVNSRWRRLVQTGAGLRPLERRLIDRLRRDNK